MSCSFHWEGLSVSIGGIQNSIETISRLLDLEPRPLSPGMPLDLVVENDSLLTAHFIGKTYYFSRIDDLVVNVVNLISTCFLNRSKQSVLHSGAIRIDDKAVLFSGLPHAGKSTLALGAWLAGYPLINDDLLLYDEKTESVSSFPKPLKPRLSSLDIPLPIIDKANSSNLCIGRFVHDIGLFIGKKSAGMVSYATKTSVRSFFYIERGSHTKRSRLSKMQALTIGLTQMLPNQSCLTIGALMNELHKKEALFHLVIGENDQRTALAMMEE